MIDVAAYRINRLIHKWTEESDDMKPAASDKKPKKRYDMGYIVTPEDVGRPRMNLWVPVVRKK